MALSINSVRNIAEYQDVSKILHRSKQPVIDENSHIRLRVESLRSGDATAGGRPSAKGIGLIKGGSVLAVSQRRMVGARPRRRKLFATLMVQRAGLLRVFGCSKISARNVFDQWLKTQENWVIISYQFSLTR